MKKIASIVLGLSLSLAGAAFAQEKGGDTKPQTKSKKAGKTGDDTKKKAGKAQHKEGK